MAELELTNRGDTWSNSDIVATVKGNKAYINGNVGGSIEYTATETIVGKWVDGRPVYRRVIEQTVTTGYTDLLEDFNTLLIGCKGCVEFSNGVTLPVQNFVTTSNKGLAGFVEVYVNDDPKTLRCRVEYSGSTLSKLHLILEYVKVNNNEN